MAGMRYASTIVYVPDVRAALRFYSDAFGLAEAFVAPDDSYGTLAGDGGHLAFAAQKMAPEPPGAPAGFEVWIEADDVPAAFAAAQAAGATPLVEPVTKPWGQTIAYVRDPSGILVEIGEPIS
jgi:catechol 2,3-dioxygenase-like lactoylglutathione lyase family enzyme